MRKTSHLCGRYILQLISPNDVPNEEYHYDSLSEAENHFSQICSLDNDDYFMAQILKTSTNHVIKRAILLGLTENEISLIREYSRGEQFETIKALLVASIDESSTNVFDLVSARLKVEKLCPVKYLVLEKVILE